jgi:hypothetical protein
MSMSPWSPDLVHSAAIVTFLIFFRFTSALAGLAVNDMIQRTAGRLESLHSEGVHVWSYYGCY